MHRVREHISRLFNDLETIKIFIKILYRLECGLLVIFCWVRQSLTDTRRWYMNMSESVPKLEWDTDTGKRLSALLYIGGYHGSLRTIKIKMSNVQCVSPYKSYVQVHVLNTVYDRWIHNNDMTLIVLCFYYNIISTDCNSFFISCPLSPCAGKTLVTVSE